MDFARNRAGDELICAQASGRGQNHLQIHSIDRRVEPACIPVLVERRREIEFYRFAVGCGDDALLDARFRLRNEDVTGERAEYRVAQSEDPRLHVSLDRGLLDRPRYAALEFEIA